MCNGLLRFGVLGDELNVYYWENKYREVVAGRPASVDPERLALPGVRPPAAFATGIKIPSGGSRRRPRMG